MSYTKMGVAVSHLGVIWHKIMQYDTIITISEFFVDYRIIQYDTFFINYRIIQYDTFFVKYRKTQYDTFF